MTTILADAQKRIMVADSMAVYGANKFASSKVERHNGSLYGLAGDVYEAMTWFRSIVGKETVPYAWGSEKEHFEVLVLSPDGSLMLHHQGRTGIPIHQRFYAVGSGDQAAMAAIRAMERLGVEPDAETAVAAACDVNAHSFLPVEVFHLDVLSTARRASRKKATP